MCNFGYKTTCISLFFYAILKFCTIILTDVFLNNHRRCLEIILAISDFNVWLYIMEENHHNAIAWY